MKYLLVLCFSLNVFAENIDTRVQTMRMQLLVPATLESITFDSRRRRTAGHVHTNT